MRVTHLNCYVELEKLRLGPDRGCRSGQGLELQDECLCRGCCQRKPEAGSVGEGLRRLLPQLGPQGGAVILSIVKEGDLNLALCNAREKEEVRINTGMGASDMPMLAYCGGGGCSEL